MISVSKDSRLWNGIFEVAQIKLKKYALERINFSHSREPKNFEIELVDQKLWLIEILRSVQDFPLQKQ